MSVRFTAVAGALALSVIGAVIDAAPAQADVPCTITNFRPRSVVVGLTPRTATFRLSTSGCTLESWSLEGESFFVYDAAPQETFNPYSNGEAGREDVIATADNADWDERQRVFPNGFSLKRRATWQSGTFNASPEAGRTLTIKGRLLVADWTNDRYKAYGGRTVSVQFRTPSGTYSTVKTAVTRSDGWLVTTVTASRTGVWRLRYGGSSIAGQALSGGDAVSIS
jgi:hypothetical protein